MLKRVSLKVIKYCMHENKLGLFYYLSRWMILTCVTLYYIHYNSQGLRVAAGQHR